MHYALAWGNINLFDFNNRLQSEKVSLRLWPVPQGQEDLLNPIGVPGEEIESKFLQCLYAVAFTICSCDVHAGSCPNEDSPCVEIEFKRFGMPVSFPDEVQMEEYAQWLLERNLNQAHMLGSTTAPQMVRATFIQIC